MVAVPTLARQGTKAREGGPRPVDQDPTVISPFIPAA